MFDYLVSKIRQAGFRWLALRDQPLFLLIEQMHRRDPRLLPSMVPHPGARGFVLSDFSHPRLAAYRGRELAFFDARHAAVYWLPGAAPRGGGHVETGTHVVTIGAHALRRPLRLGVTRTAEHTRIHEIAVQASPARSLPGCRIAFGILGAELHCLALQWLRAMRDRAGPLPDDRAFRDVLKAARALSDRHDLTVLAGLLQARLDGPRSPTTNEEGRTDVGGDWQQQQG